MAEMLSYEELGKRRPPPQWWEPAIDRKVLKGLMQRSNHSAIVSHGLYFLLLAAVGVAASLLFQHASALVDPRLLRLRDTLRHVQLPRRTRASTARR